jgi:hypothetical protein
LAPPLVIELDELISMVNILKEAVATVFEEILISSNSVL